MPRLLFITTVPVTLRAFLLPFASHFRGLGFRVDAAAADITGCPSCVAAFDQVHDLSLSRNPLQPATLLRACREIRHLVLKERYDLVHVHTPVASFVTRLALRKLSPSGRPRVIYTAHGFHFHPAGSVFSNALFAGLEKLAGRWTDYLVVINRDDAAAAHRLRLVPPQRIIHIPGIGVDRELYAPNRVRPADVARVRSELGLRGSEGGHGLQPRIADTLFLMIAEFNPGKRHQDAILALQDLPPNAHLALAGDGPRRKAMQDLATERGLRDRVHFLGVRSDVPALIRASRATLLPSAREGLPRSIMESLCLAVPVIGTDIRGIRDLVGADCGLLVPVGDSAALGRAMRRLLDHPEEARAMGSRGRAWIAGFDIRTILTLHEKLYRRALAEE